MAKINIQCPLCAKKGMIHIEDNIVLKNSRGITAVNIDELLICQHSFVAYIDKNLRVRDCFIADFTIKLPQIAIEQELEEIHIPSESFINTYLLTLNLPAQFFANVIRCCLFNMNFVVVNDLDLLNQNLINLFEFIFQGTFNAKILTISHREFRDNKKFYNNHIALDGEKVLNDKKKLLKPKNLKIESKIIQDFFDESDPKTGLIILKNEILKIYILTNETLDFIEAMEKWTALDAKKLNIYLSEIHNAKISPSYIDFLVNVVRHYYDIDILDAAEFFSGI
ncbi:MAG: hypothetical protein ACFFAS_11480 [Promethearchaeota archaeon]